MYLNILEMEIQQCCQKHMDGLVQDCSNSSAYALELLQSCTKPSNNDHSHFKGPDSGLILGLRPANERRRYKVTPSLIGQAQT